MRTKQVTVEMPDTDTAATALPALTVVDASGAYHSIDLRLRLVEAGLRGGQSITELLQKLPEMEKWVVDGPTAESADKPRLPRGGKAMLALPKPGDTSGRDAQIKQLLTGDMTVKQIAEKVGCSVATVYKVKKS